MSYEPTSDLPAAEPEYRGRGRYGTVNLCVLAVQMAAWAGLLTLIDRTPSWGVKALGILGLCTVLQGVFSMMHEYFHRNAHRNAHVNYAIGVVAATIFGSSATLHCINHWGHHLRNRTSAERGEFVHAGESWPAKITLYYFATMGGLWLGGLIFPLVSLFVPWGAVRWLSRTKEFNTYAAAFEQFRKPDWTRMRLEGLALYAVWGVLLGLGVWRWQTVLLAYACVAYHWSVLQWVYHLRTPLDIVEGAYNLRVPFLIRWSWLNFNYNLTHHRHPDLPWQDLPSRTDVCETQPLWYRYLLMWLPPKAFPSDPSQLEKTYF